MFTLISTFLAVAPLAALAAPYDHAVQTSDLMSSAVKLHTPAPRLWADNTDSWQPCGGIAFNGTRTPFPLSGGNFSFVVSRDADQLAFNYATVENPDSNSDFQLLTHELAPTTFRGHHCETAPDFSALGFQIGQKLTIQAKWKAGVADTVLYQCADVELVDPATYLPTGMCFNGAFDVATADNENYSDPGPKSGLSGGAKAGIAVGVVVAALLIGVGAFFFVKKRKAAKRSAASNAHLPNYNEAHGAPAQATPAQVAAMGEKPRL